jgi:Na+-transporting NADH:ubiquinone oxidoreductase subunit NqrC
MTRMKLVLVVLAVSLFSSVIAEGQTVFLARKALGVISRLTSPSQGYDVATVLLQAEAGKVYHTAVTLLSENSKFRITHQDAASRTLEFSDGTQVVSMKASQLQKDTTQLLVASSTAQGKASPAPAVVDGILRVCARMGVACSVLQE